MKVPRWHRTTPLKLAGQVRNVPLPDQAESPLSTFSRTRVVHGTRYEPSGYSSITVAHVTLPTVDYRTKSPAWIPARPLPSLSSKSRRRRWLARCRRHPGGKGARPSSHQTAWARHPSYKGNHPGEDQGHDTSRGNEKPVERQRQP